MSKNQKKALMKITMIETIKKRPLSQYYLWKICQRLKQDSNDEINIPSTKQVIGYLKAERKNLEKLEDEIISTHISSLAFLEESLKNISEQSFRKLLLELREKFDFQ